MIARGSSLEYRHTDQAARARSPTSSGADYLLTGTVRWEKAGGASRVRVTPELVDARPGQAARSRWGQQFDAVAHRRLPGPGATSPTKVADALGVALADSAQRELTAKPTENLAAYDEYLKGEAASQAMSVTDPPSLRRAIGFYERAVALDSTFATGLGAALPRPHAPLRRTASRTRRWASRRGSRPSAPAGSSRTIPWSTGPSARTTRPSIPIDLDRARRGVRAGRSGSRPTTSACSARSRAIEPSLGRWDSAASAARRAPRCWTRARSSSPASWPMCSRCFGSYARGRLRRRPGARARPDQSRRRCGRR